MKLKENVSIKGHIILKNTELTAEDKKVLESVGMIKAEKKTKPKKKNDK